MSSVEESGVAPDRAPNTQALGSAYVIETVIGRGSSGEVWRGHVRDSAEPIAAKVLDPALTREPEVVARFIRERALLTKVNHPNVVTVRDLVVEGDTLAIITDLVEGPSLRTVLDSSGTLRPSHAVELAEQILVGLDAVHEQGLVHRDLKPENVLVARTADGEARARIVDFGIAELAHGDSANERGEIVGSAEYIAPELLEGGEATPASDLYAVGIVLYELLCGRTPFGSQSVVTVIRRQLNEPPGRPAGMPMELWAVLQALLAKDPERRPGSAGEARELLTGVAASVRTTAPLPVADEDDPAILDGDETIITPRRRGKEPATRPTAPVAAPTTRRRWLLAGAVLVVVALVATLVVVTGGDESAHAASIQSAPEYWTDRGSPIVHRTLTLDGDAIDVTLDISSAPAKRYQIHEFVPKTFRHGVTVPAKPAPNIDQGGLFDIAMPPARQPAGIARTSYRVPIDDLPQTEAALRSYERQRVALLRPAAALLAPETLTSLETPSEIRLHPVQRAWLPVSGGWAGPDHTKSVADSLGIEHWKISNSKVITIRAPKVDRTSDGRIEGHRYFEVEALAQGDTTLSTDVGGHHYDVHVHVRGAPRTGSICEPGVASSPGHELVRGEGSSHFVTGTLLRSKNQTTTYKATDPDHGAVRVTGALCSDAQVVRVSPGELFSALQDPR